MAPLASPGIRACDSCRRRKVRCDASRPCANCRIAQRCCEHAVARKKRGPKVPSAKGSPGAVTSCSGEATNVNPANHPPRRRFPDGQARSDPLSFWQLANMPSPPNAEALPSSTRTCQSIRERLLLSTKPALSGASMVDIVNYCIDLYMRYTFPTAPLVHEPTLRVSASRFFYHGTPGSLFEAESEAERVAEMRAFALVTGLCASVSSVIPEHLLPCRQFLAEPFLKASQDVLLVYETYDQEHPNSTSLTIRTFHSTAIQQNTGKFGAAWHIHGQACLLAQRLRLYSEQAVTKHDPLETHLLRLNFWHLYSSDNAAAAFRTRPFTLHKTLFDEELTLQPYGDQGVFLLDPDAPADKRSLEERVMTGFHLIVRIWTSAASLVFGARKYSQVESQETRSRLGQEYLDFMGLLDGLPPWLRISDIVASHGGDDVVTAQKSSFWVQRCTIMVTFHCLRLVILQQCIDSDSCEIAGFTKGQVYALLMKKLEMIQDFVQTLEDMPFLYLQVKGEPNIERIRRVGAILLEFIETVDSEPLKARAKSFFRRLLDILSKLDSKVSDALAQI